MVDKSIKYWQYIDMKTEEKYTQHYFKRLYFEIGSFFDDYQTVEITRENSKLKLVYNSQKNISNRNKLLVVNTKDYKTFFDNLAKINIENWDNNYSHRLYTGFNWKLKLYFRPSVVYEKEGDNNYPNNFSQLIDFIKYYFPNFDVDINIKTTLNEDDLLKIYCTCHTGVTFTEVSIGDKNIFGKNSKNRRIDAVRINNDHKIFRLKYCNNKELFMNLIKNDKYKIELIEIKTKLNRLVIGQIIVGEYMFRKKFKVDNTIKTILYHEGDEALELFCNENKIVLEKY
jgi:hypothetical protein